MNQHRLSGAPSRRTILRHAATASVVAAGTIAGAGSLFAEAMSGRRANGPLRPVEAIPAILAAMQRYPLVAMTERHMLQEWHDLITALLFHPDLPGTINDIVVEFGNAAFQDLADRFVLGDRPVARADLVQIWRQIGDPTWNAPIYEQFFRSVRAVNWMQPPARRIRVLLGQAPLTMTQVLAQPTDRALIRAFASSTPLNAHYADVVERDVLSKGRRALLIAGGGHVLRGLRDDSDSHQLNAVSRLAQRHPGSVFVIDLLILPPGAQQDALAQRVQAEVARWPRPALALLAGTWLGATTHASPPWINEMADRAASAAASRYGAQADAVLYLGPGEALTASLPDPAIYHWGAYPEQVRRVGQIAGAGDQLAVGLRWAQSGPGWFSLFG
jgi:hypothetical protein